MIPTAQILLLGWYNAARPMQRRRLISLALCFACLRLLLGVAADVPGLRYQHRKTGSPHSIHILEVDPHLLKIEAVRALDDGVGRETVSSIAQRKGVSPPSMPVSFASAADMTESPTGSSRFKNNGFRIRRGRKIGSSATASRITTQFTGSARSASRHSRGRGKRRKSLRGPLPVEHLEKS